MATSFRYKAQDAMGKVVSGEFKANDQAELQGKLKESGLLLIDAKEQGKEKKTYKKLKFDRVADFSRNLSKLLAAGVTLVRALRIIAEDESIKESERKTLENTITHEVLHGLMDDYVRTGRRLTATGPRAASWLTSAACRSPCSRGGPRTGPPRRSLC